MVLAVAAKFAVRGVTTGVVVMGGGGSESGSWGDNGDV